MDEVPGAVADRMRKQLDCWQRDRTSLPSWSGAFPEFTRKAEDVGVLVMVSGTVGSDTTRVLDVAGFRGFALSDKYAPVVFTSGRDGKAARMFTLARELAHIWLGESGVSGAGLTKDSEHRVERWCNAVAAELLVSLADLSEKFGASGVEDADIQRVARHYKVSSLVALRRLCDMGACSQTEYWGRFHELRDRAASAESSSGGSFYRTAPVCASARFTRAIVVSALEGHTLFRDVGQLLEFQKASTFQELARSLRVI